MIFARSRSFLFACEKKQKRKKNRKKRTFLSKQPNRRTHCRAKFNVLISHFHNFNTSSHCWRSMWFVTFTSSCLFSFVRFNIYLAFLSLSNFTSVGVFLTISSCFRRVRLTIAFFKLMDIDVPYIVIFNVGVLLLRSFNVSSSSSLFFVLSIFLFVCLIPSLDGQDSHACKKYSVNISDSWDLNYALLLDSNILSSPYSRHFTQLSIVSAQLQNNHDERLSRGSWFFSHFSTFEY